MREACRQAGVPFSEVTSNFPDFFESLTESEEPRLLLIEDLTKKASIS